MIQSRFNNDLDQLLKISAPKEIAVAVSGGADSIALLHLISNWSKRFDIKLSVFSVDHNLRPESCAEISYVKQLAQNLGHEFYPLSWSCGGNKTNLQERARQGRYDLMSKKCSQLGIKLLLTAHHLDDMLETYLMRKNKKSGILGLSSSSSFFYNNIHILRPLSNLTKDDLIQYLKSENIQWMEDSSNKSDLYERNRIRKQIGILSADEKADLLEEMRIINEKADSLNKQLIIAMAECLQINNYGFARVDLLKLNAECQEIKIQILNYILTIISGKTSLPRFRSMEKIIAKINNGIKIQSSLHGCLLEQKDKDLWILREKSAIDSSKKDLKLLQYWDNRFELTSSKSLSNHYIDRLSFDDYLLVKNKINLDKLAQISANKHKLILFTLPVIKNLEKVVAIPHISYYDGFDQREADLKVVFRPDFISRFTHFL